jgi:glycosyltransferase involved in cell wall biosynthesis
VVVGDGPLRRRLQRRYPWCHFTGFLPRPELAAHYASGDLFLYPSVTETFGNVVTEAMASGLPVVAFNYAAAARYLRHEQNGYLVPLENRDAFLLGALQLASDPLLRQPLGRAARITAEGISWDAVIDGFETDLARVAAGSGPAWACSPGKA